MQRLAVCSASAKSLTIRTSCTQYAACRTRRSATPSILAFREHTSSTLEDLELDQTAIGSGRYMDLTIMPMQVEPGAPSSRDNQRYRYHRAVQVKKRLEAVQREHAELVSELSAANKRFADMNKELQDANEELQAANEELMLTQEELQATNEEFEATNEELQATNEELETNNEELQATNEELQTTNDELTARTVELQHLTQRKYGRAISSFRVARAISLLRHGRRRRRIHDSSRQSGICLVVRKARRDRTATQRDSSAVRIFTS